MTTDALTDPWATTTTPPADTDPAAPFLQMPQQRALQIGPRSPDDLDDVRRYEDDERLALHEYETFLGF